MSLYRPASEEFKKVSTDRRKRKVWKRACRTCKVDGIQLDYITGSKLEDYPQLQPAEKWKFGQLYRCEKCGSNWFLHESGKRLIRIRNHEFSSAQYWNRTKLTIEASMLQTLGAIGGIQDSYDESIAVPCSIQNVSGQWHEKALVIFSKCPPAFQPQAKESYSANDIATVTSSPYALPYGIRKASNEKEEESMGFAPIDIVDPQKNLYTLSHPAGFLDAKGLKGQDMELSPQQGGWREDIGWEYGLLLCLLIPTVWHIRSWITGKKLLPKRPKTISSASPEACYYVDWFEHCEEMLIPAPLK